MNDTIYSANLLQVFSGWLMAIFFFFSFAFAGWLLIRQDKKAHLDLPVTAAVVVLIIAGMITLAAMVYSFTLASQTMTGRLTEKHLVTRNTSRSTGSSYRLYFGPLIAFDEPDESAFNRMAAGECYQITSYRNVLPSGLIDQNESGMQVTSLVAEIRLVPTHQCP